MSEATLLENKAKKTLAYLSQNPQRFNQQNWEQFTEMTPIRLQKQLQPIFRNKIKRNKNMLSHLTNTRPIFNLRKVSVENQTFEINPPRHRKIKDNKENSKPAKTLRKFYSLSKKAQQKQEEQGVNFMHYWIKHRFQQGSINALVEKLKQNRSFTPMIRS